uniref:Uncharacterized protein n=1 Tax=Nothobranchius furzeri TaxID=105023 RepID=A0A1A8A3H6_NOTFU
MWSETRLMLHLIDKVQRIFLQLWYRSFLLTEEKICSTLESCFVSLTPNACYSPETEFCKRVLCSPGQVLQCCPQFVSWKPSLVQSVCQTCRLCTRPASAKITTDFVFETLMRSTPCCWGHESPRHRDTMKESLVWTWTSMSPEQSSSYLHLNETDIKSYKTII